tara:strand:+ start:447 stop:983 length:537 start_codon:yes stop_codon:yes gene_type:complete
MSYRTELIRSMKYLSKNKKVIFLGQSVNYSGNAIFNTLNDVDSKKKIELPVFEDTQMGLSTGLALNGFIPVTCYPRFDFLILSLNQLVNHLDKIKEMSLGKLKAKVIIRTSIGARKPLDGGPQHTQDHTLALKKMLKNVEVIKLNKTEQIFKAYKKALNRKDGRSTLLVEYGAYYNKP